MIRQFAGKSSKGICCLLAGALLTFPGPVQAQNFEQMQGWSPGKFEIVCGDSGAISGLANQLGIMPQDCINSVARQRIENFSDYLLGEYRRDGFKPPYRFGPVIDATRSAGRAVRIFTSLSTTYANIGSVSGTCAPLDQRVFTINPNNLAPRRRPPDKKILPKHVLAYIAGHELFHTIQGNFPIHMWPGRSGPDNCFPPYWVSEGIADAVSITRARQLVPGYFPPRPAQKAGFSWAGLRPYYVPLYSTGIPKVAQYRTSSFWRFLAEIYHGGRLKFLEDYSMTPPPGGKNSEDWLAWLDQALLSDPNINTPLHLVYPGFLSHFAGDWAGSGDGKYFGRSLWLKHAFGACTQLTLSPQNPYSEEPMSLYPMAGKCVSVTVKGLNPDDRATVKVGVLTDSLNLANSMHLGFAFTNDQTKFNCAKLVRKTGVRKGAAGCLFEPVTGTFGTVSAARMWHASALELGPGAEQTIRTAGNEIENVYILSRVPTSPKLLELRQLGAANFQIAAGLEISHLSTDSTGANSGAADGTRRTARRRAVGAMGLQSLEADTTVPPSTGWIDDQGMASLGGGSIFGLIGEARRMGSLLALQADPTGIVERLLLFKLAEARIVPLGGAPSEERIEVIKLFQVSPVEPLPEGATGTFRAGITGEEPARNLVYYSEKHGDATLTVLENSRDVFRASISGDVCVVENWAGLPNIEDILKLPLKKMIPALAAVSKNFNPCPSKIHVSGSISKPFAYLYRQSSQLFARETESEKLYNLYGPPRLMRAVFGRMGSGGFGGGGGSGASSGGGGSGLGGVQLCNCTCPDLVSPQTAQCRGQCKFELAICPAPQASVQSPPAIATPQNITAQTKIFGQLISGQGLAPDVEQMLIRDFATMSVQTRTYLISRYKNGTK